MRVLVSCANGSGTSLMIRRSVEKAFEDLGLKITNIHHCAISEGRNQARNYDVVFTPRNFVNMFANAERAGVQVIGVQNAMSSKEIEESIKEAGLAN